MWLLDQLFRPRVIAPPELLPQVQDLRTQLDVTQRMLRDFDQKLQVIAAIQTDQKGGTARD